MKAPHVLEFEQWVAAPPEQVFRFFSDPRNLALISPPWSGAQLKSLQLKPPPYDLEWRERMAGTGSEIEVSFRLLPYFPLRGSWTARIVEFEWLRSFRDVQVKGPFKRFEHTHTFAAEEREGKSGTAIRDHVAYEVGYGALGTIANGLVVQQMLQQMFKWRHQATEKYVST